MQRLLNTLAIAICTLCITIAIPSPALAQLDDEQKSVVTAIRGHLKDAGIRYRAGEIDKAEVALDAAADELRTLPRRAAVQEAVRPLRRSLEKARSLVEQRRKETASRDDNSGPTKDKGVSFSLELAETLSARCSTCHGGNDNRPRRGLRLTSYSYLMIGSDSGTVISRRDAADSLIVAKMKGEAEEGDRMPPNGDALTPEFIARFEKWINEGARFDGSDENLALDQVVTNARRSRMSADELRATAVETARTNWELAFPGQEVNVKEVGNFLIVARPNFKDTAAIADIAEDSLQTSFKLLVQSKPKLAAPITIYILPKQYDLSEFIQMAEKREASARSLRHHWRNDGAAGYVVLGPPAKSKKAREYIQPASMSRLISSLLTSRWGAPAWYAEGAGQHMLLRLEKRSPLVRDWQRRQLQVMRTLRSEDFFRGRVPAANADVATFAFADYLLSNPRRALKLHTQMAAGTKFDIAFESVFGSSEKVVCDAWIERAKGNRKRP